MDLSRYRKFAVALAGAAVIIVTTLWADSPWATVVVAIAAALGVYQVPNQQPPAGTSGPPKGVPGPPRV